MSKRYTNVYKKIEDKIKKSFMRKWLRIKLKIWYDKEGKKYKKLKGKSNGMKGKIKWVKYPIESKEWKTWGGK